MRHESIIRPSCFFGVLALMAVWELAAPRLAWLLLLPFLGATGDYLIDRRGRE